MSDEAHMESAYRHRDLTRREPWHGMAPDEELMAREEGPCEMDRRADVQEALFCYLFAGGAERWEAVALRALSVLRRMVPALMSGRKVPQVVLDAVVGYYAPGGAGFRRFDLRGLEELVDGDFLVVEKLMEFFFPDGGDWLREGCRRLYLVARAYQPDLVKIGEKEASYEELARIFGELDGTHPDEGARARSRWSARAQMVLTRPIERAGGKVGSLFGKSSAVREKYRAAAEGNGNRRVGSAECRVRSGNEQILPPAAGGITEATQP